MLALITSFLALIRVVIWLAHILLVVHTSLGNIMALWVLGVLILLAASTAVFSILLCPAPVIDSHSFTVVISPVVRAVTTRTIIRTGFRTSSSRLYRRLGEEVLNPVLMMVLVVTALTTG